MALFRRTSTRTCFAQNTLFGSSFSRSYSAGGDTKQEYAKWKKIAIGSLAFLGISHLVILAAEEEDTGRKQFAHMFLMNKRFPWGDGKTPLFGDAAARHEAHHEEHH